MKTIRKPRRLVDQLRYYAKKAEKVAGKTRSYETRLRAAERADAYYAAAAMVEIGKYRV